VLSIFFLSYSSVTDVTGQYFEKVILKITFYLCTIFENSKGFKKGTTLANMFFHSLFSVNLSPNGPAASDIMMLNILYVYF
jgi:hypothetical protein